MARMIRTRWPYHYLERIYHYFPHRPRRKGIIFPLLEHLVKTLDEIAFHEFPGLKQNYVFTQLYDT